MRSQRLSETTPVVDADTPRFWNLTWSVIGDPPDGTFYFNNEPNPWISSWSTRT
jgi:hypothetical protein